MDIMYAKIAKPIYQIRSRITLRKHTTVFAKTYGTPTSWFGDVLQYIL